MQFVLYWQESVNANEIIYDETSVIKTGPVVDSVRALGQWVIGWTTESLVEPVDSVDIKKIYKSSIIASNQDKSAKSLEVNLHECNALIHGIKSNKYYKKT